MKHLVIFRSSGSFLDYNTYNCQEIGLAKSLVKKGFKVSIVFAGYEKKHVQISCDNGVIDLYYLKFFALKQAFCIFFGWKDLLESLKPDIIQIHEFGMSMSYFVTKWAKYKQIPVYLIQGSYEKTHKIFFRQLEELYNRTLGSYVLKNVNGIGCKSNMASSYVKHYENRETFSTLVGLDPSKFTNTKVSIDTETLFKSIKGRKVLLYVGVLEKRRNPDFLIDVIKSLPDDYCLLIIGDGPLKEHVSDRIEKETLKNKVWLLGKLQQEQLPYFYQNSDLFLLASDYEIYGMVVLESMYFGTPVVSTATAGSEVIIDNNINGYVLSEKNLDKWCKVIVESIGNESTLETLKLNAKNKINNHLIWDMSSEGFIQLYGR